MAQGDEPARAGPLKALRTRAKPRQSHQHGPVIVQAEATIPILIQLAAARRMPQVYPPRRFRPNPRLRAAVHVRDRRSHRQAVTRNSNRSCELIARPQILESLPLFPEEKLAAKIRRHCLAIVGERKVLPRGTGRLRDKMKRYL